MIYRFILSFFLIFMCSPLFADNNLQSIEQNLSDSVITAKIKAKFAKNHDLNPLKISVKTQDGVVTLSGHVNTNQAFVDALRIAKSIQSVKTVEVEKLIIKPVNTALTDTYITAKVEAAVLKAKVLDDESIPLAGINATTENGQVTLSGVVKKTKSILAIIKRVNEVKGVKEIRSNLKVENDQS